MSESNQQEGEWETVQTKKDKKDKSTETKGEKAKDEDDEKIMYILRGISGSGKSTLAKELNTKHGNKGVILSTDDYFMHDGVYKYQPSKIPDAHAWNQQRALDAITKGISPVIIDNTNTQKWEAKFYVVNGLQFGYSIEIKEPNTPWKNNPAELAKRNSHGVTEEIIGRMLAKWETDFTVDNILTSQQPEFRPRNNNRNQANNKQPPKTNDSSKTDSESDKETKPKENKESKPSEEKETKPKPSEEKEKPKESKPSEENKEAKPKENKPKKEKQAKSENTEKPRQGNQFDLLGEENA